jgi:uncharacterized Zn-finger protein
MMIPGCKSVCDVCNKGFSRKSRLSEHLPVHGEDTTSYKCEYCDQQFDIIMELRKHMLKHKDKAFTCEECFTAFNHSVSLKRHMLNHKGLKPHICEECGVGFTVEFDLKDHIKIHTGERVINVYIVKNHLEGWYI